MKVYFLGTNGWYDTQTGNTVCVLVETVNKYVIFDAGNGLYKIDRYITKNKPILLFLSHYHLDHIIGFHTLAKFKFKQGLDIYGPVGLKTLFKKVINRPYTIPISQLKTKVRLHELNNPDALPNGIEYAKLRHSSVCYGYRLLAENKSVVYCTDTGLCNSLYSLIRRSDLFIIECSLRSGQFNRGWPHLNPESAAKVADEAEAKKMVLIHFDASLYPDFQERAEALKISKKIFKNSSVSYDGMKIEL